MLYRRNWIALLTAYRMVEKGIHEWVITPNTEQASVDAMLEICTMHSWCNQVNRMTHTFWPGGWSVLLEANTCVTVVQMNRLYRLFDSWRICKYCLIEWHFLWEFCHSAGADPGFHASGGGGGEDGANPPTETLYITIFSEKNPWNREKFGLSSLPILQCTGHWHWWITVSFGD